MSTSQYKPLKCDDCGKTLGYIHDTVKIYPSKLYLGLVAGRIHTEINRTTFCEKCFLKRKAENAKQK